MIRSAIALASVLLLLCACDSAEHAGRNERDITTSVPAEGVLARYAGGQITVDELDDHILELPAGERPLPGADLDAWYSDQIKRLVVEHRLLQDALDSGLQRSEEFQQRQSAIERQLSVQSCLARGRPELGEITNEQITMAYDERAEQFEAPERRSVFHIYRRLSPGQDVAELESEMLALRDRVLRGENFQRLAQAESDSESRHRQGSLDWVVRGQLPEAFEDVIFSLDEGVPGRPVVTADGAHLFLVDDIYPARKAPLAEAAAALRAQLEVEAVDAALDELAALNTSPTATMIDRDTLATLIEEGAEQEPVLIAESRELSLEQFRVRLGRVVGSQQTPGDGFAGRVPADTAWQFLARIHRHEVVFEYCRKEALIDHDAVAASMADWETRALVDRMRQIRLSERVTVDTDRLALFYQSNIGQYTPPVQWKLRRLVVPYQNAEQARALMTRLENVAAADSTGLDGLDRPESGTIEDLGWNSLAQLRRIHPKLPQLVSPIEGQALVAPIHVLDGLALFEVLDRRQSEPRPFEDVRERVAAAYLRQYTSEVYDALEAGVLERVGFELFPERLAEVREAGLPRPEDLPEISVEQLDALLSEE